MPWAEMVNELEKPVFYKHRFLAEMKSWLQQQSEVEAAMMTGSGSTMMAFMKTGDHSDQLISRAKLELSPNMWVKKVAVLH